ncbi:hypothetical protein AH04_228 [Erwinia phage AH04]|uniref:Uncharacterized protein n=1 Tax=Erwinia phage AH04 TaxID=2869569 RepID=A0AAE7X163_9CAUD|nr:hypothetical protein PQC02_gp086 [Erwinia phage AH04]QZA70780.1 hypothetical protein AH04_228 [Erwinia phage AH04]
MRTFIFGFGWELLGFTLYYLAWGWIASLLENKITWLQNRVIWVGALSAAMLHPFVVNYIVVVFWTMMAGTILLLWGRTTGDFIKEKLTWIRGINAHLLRLAILVIAFVILRNSMFYYYPEKVWYY